MRSPDDIRQRWTVMQAHGRTLAELQHSVKWNGLSSPCVTGLRSVCWKTFLLSKAKAKADWTMIDTLRDGRDEYTRLCEHWLKYIKHPEALAEVTVDPLADDPDSPWDTIRQDEVIRTEIRQDVQRLPDEANYHDDRFQNMVLDILFIYCKVNPNHGGYRQGMHELLAPFVQVLEDDAIDRAAVADQAGLDEQLLELVDADFIEHDAYILFTTLMNHAQTFYAVTDQGGSATETSTIVERSQFIHQVCLEKVDPELASHLTSIEVLPQIFLIRWVRLLFSREFPFEQFLILWDTMFAVDPSLELIDLICVAMLLRVRWQLLEGDYSVCLQSLLKYPSPEQPHGPNTFVDDALYLRGHMNPSGGATLIMKYTGKLPSALKSPDSSPRPSTPSFRGFNALRQRAAGARSPLTSPPFRNQQVGVEALFQGAAKGARGVFERGEKLGINQAVRDAMGEIRRNVQGFNESRQSPHLRREGSALGEEEATSTLAALEHRNRQLATMLDETVASLKEVSASSLEDKAKSLELIEVAAAKVQFVKIYLEDSSMEVPLAVESPEPDSRIQSDDTPIETPLEEPTHLKRTDLPRQESDMQISTLSLVEDGPAVLDEGTQLSQDQQAPSQLISPKPKDPPSVDSHLMARPGPIPTRSTLAQSSFSWMLEPNETSSSTRARTISSKSPPAPGHKKGPSNSASRERNAFLFGEIPSGSETQDRIGSDDIFGMEPLRKTATGDQSLAGTTSDRGPQ